MKISINYLCILLFLLSIFKYQSQPILKNPNKPILKNITNEEQTKNEKSGDNNDDAKLEDITDDPKEKENDPKRYKEKEKVNEDDDDDNEKDVQDMLNNYSSLANGRKKIEEDNIEKEKGEKDDKNIVKEVEKEFLIVWIN